MKFFVKIFITIAILVLGHVAKASVDVNVVANSGYVGDIIMVAVNTPTELTGQGIFSFQFEMSYNDAYLEVIEVINTGTLTDGWGVFNYSFPVQNRLHVVSAGGQELTGSGDLFYIKVRLIRKSNYYINFTDSEFNMLNEGTSELVLQGARINISDRPSISVSPNSGTVAIGRTLQFYTSSGTAPYTYSVSDPTVASVDGNGLLTGLRRGSIYVISEDQGGIVDSTDNMINIVPFHVTIRDTSCYQNQYIDIPVNISSLDVEDVVSGTIELSFNSNVLDAEGVVVAGTLLESTYVESDVSHSGKVNVSFAGNAVLTGSGVLFYVHFKVADIPSGASHINFEEVVFNQELYATLDNGYYSVIRLPNLNVTPRTASLLVGETLDFNVSGGTAPYTWTVSDNSLATINADGLLTVVSGGDVMVTANDVYGATGSSQVISLYDGELFIGQVESPVNVSSVIVPVDVTTLEAGKEMLSFSGEVDVVPDKIQQFNLDQGATLSATWAGVSNTEGQLFKFALAGVNGTLGGDVLLNLEVELDPGVSIGNVIPVNMDHVVANEGSPRLKVNQGQITIMPSTGVHRENDDAIRIYPNPLADVLNFSSATIINKVIVYDITGKQVNYKEVGSVKSGSVDIVDLQQGIYIVHLIGQTDYYKKVNVR